MLTHLHGEVQLGPIDNSVAKNLLVSKGQLKECKLMSSTARTPVQEYTEVRSKNKMLAEHRKHSVRKIDYSKHAVRC